jgi:hypothetical protein
LFFKIEGFLHIELLQSVFHHDQFLRKIGRKREKRLVPLDGYTIPIFDGKNHGFDPFSYVQNWRWWELFQKIDMVSPKAS